MRVGQAQGEVCGEAEAGGGECGGMRGWGLLALGLSGSAAGALLIGRAAAEQRACRSEAEACQERNGGRTEAQRRPGLLIFYHWVFGR